MVHSVNQSLSTSLESSRYELSTESLLARSSDERLASDSKRGPRARLKRSWTPSMTYERLRCICIGLHAALVALYGSLLGIAILRFEQRIVVPLGRASDIVSAGIVITSQAFILLYTSGLVVCTQQLALRRILLLRQTLTATHDTSQAWTGLGAAVLSLWRQTTVRAAMGGTLAIAAYLTGIGILHITTTSLFSLQVFNATVSTPINVAPAYPNYTTGIDFSSIIWLLNFADHMQASSTLGLLNSTLYNVPQEAPGLGNATVNATTFNVSCGYIAAPVVQYSWTPGVDPSVDAVTNLSAEHISFSIGASQMSMSQTTFPLYTTAKAVSNNNMLGVSGVPLADRNIPISIYGQSVHDSSGAVNSVVIGQDNGTFKYPDSQVLGCTLSCTNHTATVDVLTKQLIAMDALSFKTESRWTPWNPNVFAKAEPDGFGYTLQLDAVLDNWSALCHSFNGIQRIEMDEPKSYGPVNDYISRRLADVVSSDSNSRLYLHDVENILADMTAAVVWASMRFSDLRGLDSSSQVSDQASTFYLQKVLMSRVTLSLPQLIAGGSMSLFILGLAIIMVRSTADQAKVDGAGFLQIYWLLRERPDLQHLIPHVDDPTVQNLRVAGMVRTQVDGTVMRQSE